MNRFVAALVFLLLPIQGFAKEQLRKFRHFQDSDSLRPHGPLIKGLQPAASLGDSARRTLRGVGELVVRGAQMVGGARIAGTWEQSTLNSSGKLTSHAGAVADKVPDAKLLAGEEILLTDSLQKAMATMPGLRDAARVFPPQLEVRQESNGEWTPYWRVEYLTPKEDQLRYLLLSSAGTVLDQGALAWDGVDGRAAVFPKGPKFGGVEDGVLRDLTGDGTVTGRLIQVVSALNLQVWSPELQFFFPQEDRRFDLGQAYYTIDQGFHWLRDHLGIELTHPISVRLHVGQGGMSNAAFYHQNTIYLGTGDGQTYRDMIRDPSVLIHESIHAVIDAYAGLPSEGEGGSFNEGFADLFTGLILENPRMAEASYLKAPYRRTLENRLKAYQDFVPGVYQNGTIIGGTFWDMRGALGTELTAKLAFRTLVRLGPGAKFDDFPAALASAADGLLSPDQTRVVMVAARERGWRVSP